MKQTQLFALLILLFCSQTIFAQHFAFGFNATGKKATFLVKKSRFGYKYDVAKKVMDDLIEAKGVRNMAIPTLKMTNASRRVAYAKPNEAIIGLENKAYDVCMTFGKDSLNALAALLAHELTHYYEKHDWKNQFAKDFGSVSSTGDKAAEKLDIETQADYLGGFLAYTAGYNALDIMPQFLKKVYTAYNFGENLKGYPSLSKRIEMSTKSLKKLEQLIPIFETANYLVAMKDYESAKAYYDYILVTEKYQSREIYNNLGVTATHLAMDLFSEGDLQYIYPVELDVKTRLDPSIKGAGDDTEKRRKLLLNEAVKYFENAKVLDPDYAIAYLNLGCAYALQANFFDAEYHARKALQIAESQGAKKVASDADVLLGIIKARQGQQNDAENFFNQAIRSKNPFGQLNLNILKGNSNPYPASSGTAFARPEQIDGVDLDELVNEMYLGGLTTAMEINITRKTLFALIKESNSKVLLNYLPSSDAYHIFQKTNPNYTGKTNKGIQIGDEMTKLVSAEGYGQPENIFNVSTGQILIYTKFKLLFFTDKNGRVQSWAVFREKLEE